ncbi:hypothetical protein BC827DRAFT_1210998 [Russula dissimulans]|nr:hypothetical protein BC827DRAFT_1210998 [Russula dissimulans]
MHVCPLSHACLPACLLVCPVCPACAPGHPHAHLAYLPGSETYARSRTVSTVAWRRKHRQIFWTRTNSYELVEKSNN